MKVSLWLIGTFFFLCACENEITEIGKRFEDNTRFVEVKRFEIDNSATIRLDSFPTSIIQGVTNDSIVVIGKMNDLTTGTITSSAFFEVHPLSSSYFFDFSDAFVYDSLTLVINRPRIISGDTTAMQHFHLHRLKEVPHFDERWPIYNNVDTVPLGDRVGSMQIFPQKEYMTYTYFKLSDTWGREIYSLLARRENVLFDRWAFLEYFKGLAIVPDEHNAALFTVSSMFELRCYYHQSNRGDQPLYAILANGSMGNMGRELLSFFTFTHHKHVPTPDLKGVSEKNPLPFLTHNYAVIQGLNGYMLKLELPYIQEYNRYRTIVKAQIALTPRLENYENIPDATIFHLYECDVFGVPRGVVATGYSDPTMPPENKRFIFDITDYYKNLVQRAAGQQEIHLLVGLPGYVVPGIDNIRFISGHVNTSFARMVVREIPELFIHYIQFK
jgi:hypothetical protein